MTPRKLDTLRMRLLRAAIAYEAEKSPTRAEARQLTALAMAALDYARGVRAVKGEPK